MWKSMHQVEVSRVKGRSGIKKHVKELAQIILQCSQHNSYERALPSTHQASRGTEKNGLPVT